MIRLAAGILTIVAVRNAWRGGRRDLRLAGFRRWLNEGLRDAEYEWRPYQINLRPGDLPHIVKEFADV